MSERSLIEYRCACGKLLFRGLLLLSVVEVKCKRCGTLKLFENELFSWQSSGQAIGASISFILTIHENGKIFDACRASEYVLNYPRETLLKMSIDELCPMLRDVFLQVLSRSQPTTPSEPKLKKEKLPLTHYINDNTFLLRNGNKLPAKTYFVKCDTPPDAYHMVNIVS